MALKKTPKKPAKKSPKKGKKPSKPRARAKAFALAADAISMDDARQAVRDCLANPNLLGANTASKIKLSTKIADSLPDGDDGAGLQSLIDCINDSQQSDLDSRDFAGGSFQDIADKLAGVGENA